MALANWLRQQQLEATRLLVDFHYRQVIVAVPSWLLVPGSGNDAEMDAMVAAGGGGRGGEKEGGQEDDVYGP